MNQDSIYQETYPRLFSLAYRMTGSVSDAEDVIQEAWERLLNQPTGKVESPPKWLYRTVSNLAIDSLRSATRTNSGYHGPWLPEPVSNNTSHRGPEAEAIVREEVSMALLMMLENLSPLQRAVWVLRTSLELSYSEVGEIVGRSEQTCRQIFHRASQRLTGKDEDKLDTAPPSLVEKFLAAVQSGNADLVAGLLMENSTWIGDGGGVKPATMRPVLGAEKVARGLTSLMNKPAYQSQQAHTGMVNGALSLLVYEHGELDAIYMFLGSDSHVSHVLTFRNPHKLRGVATQESRTN